MDFVVPVKGGFVAFGGFLWWTKAAETYFVAHYAPFFTHVTGSVS